MYLNSGSDTVPDLPDADDGFARRLLARATAAFPDIVPSTVRLDRTGGDHLLLILDERLAFRFPRRGGPDPDLEARVLRRLQRLVSILVPVHDHLPQDGGFVGYRFIPGVPLIPSRCGNLSVDHRTAVLDGIADVLHALHGLDPDAIGSRDRWPRMWSAVRFADRVLIERLSPIAARSPVLGDAIAEFLPRYRDQNPPREAVLHGDLVAEHLLIDEAAGRLAGIIDFADVALGDPACDFLGLWVHGRAVVEQAIRRYDPDGTDPGLLDRSHGHAVRYAIDRLYEAIRDDAGSEAVDRRITAVAEHLGACPPVPGTHRGSGSFGRRAKNGEPID